MTDLRDARVLVTGATGFVGAHLTRRLLTEGARVAAFRRFDSRPGPGFDDRARPDVDWHEVDVRTYAAVAAAVRSIRPDAVFHLAAAGVSDPFLTPDAAIRANVYGTIHVLRAVDGKAPVIVARTPGERDALNVYAASKAAAWAFCRMYRRAHGWPVVGATLFQVYGPGQADRSLVPSAVRAALRGEDFPMTRGDQQRDWIYVGDAVDALVRLAQAGRPDAESVDVGTGCPLAVREVVETIYRLVGGSGRPRVGALPERPGEAARQAADAERAAQLLGWRASVTLEDGLRDTIEWMREWSINPAR